MTRTPMHRRSFLTLLGVSAAALPLAAKAQQLAMPVIGLLSLGSPEAIASNIAALRQGLGEAGFVEGRNVTIEYRFANNDRDQLAGLAADLIRRGVNVIMATQLSAALAAKAATSTIPIVAISAGDPVASGLVASLNRPGGNVTAITDMGQELAAKRFGLLHELNPGSAPLVLLLHPTNPSVEFLVHEAQAGAAAIGRPIELLYVSTPQEIDNTFASLAQKRIGGLSIATDTFLASRRVQTVTLAIRHSIPTIYSNRLDVAAGGLMSYASDLRELQRQAGIYVGRILKGEKPSDLPIVRATKFQFVINFNALFLQNLFKHLRSKYVVKLSKTLYSQQKPFRRSVKLGAEGFAVITSRTSTRRARCIAGRGARSPARSERRTLRERTGPTRAAHGRAPGRGPVTRSPR